MTGLVLYPERQCETCVPMQQVMWGCEADVSIPLVVEGIEYRRCPMRPWLDHRDAVQRTMYFYRFYRNHQYPDPGTFFDQSARYLRLMEIVDTAFAAADEVKRARGK